MAFQYRLACALLKASSAGFGRRDAVLPSWRGRAVDVLLYQRGDLMAIVEDAAGDLQLRGNYLV